MWDLRTGSQLVELNSETISVAISPDQCLLAAGQTDGTLLLWNVQSGQFLTPLKVFESGIEDLAFSADGRLLALGSVDGDVVIWGMPNALEQPAGSVPKIRCGQ
jgi:WD40 repeat protein